MLSSGERDGDSDMFRVLVILAVAAALWTWYTRHEAKTDEEVQGVVTDQQMEYMQRARDTEEVLLDAADQQRQQIDQQAE